MDLETKQNIARENGKKSKGPVTPEGKQRSSLNGITHGLASKCVVLANESEEAYEDLLDSYRKKWEPSDVVEQHLVIQMANAYWRLRRIWSMETALFDSEMFSQQKGFDAAWSHHHPAMRVTDALAAIHASNAPTLETLHRYELRYHRIYKDCGGQLNKFRRGRRLPEMPLTDPEMSAELTDIAAPETQPDQPISSSPTWRTRLLAFLLSILGAIRSISQGKSQPNARLRSTNRSPRTTEPTPLSVSPLCNFQVPELFLWLSLFTRVPPQPQPQPSPAKEGIPDSSQ